MKHGVECDIDSRLWNIYGKEDLKMGKKMTFEQKLEEILLILRGTDKQRRGLEESWQERRVIEKQEECQ